MDPLELIEILLSGLLGIGGIGGLFAGFVVLKLLNFPYLSFLIVNDILGVTCAYTFFTASLRGRKTNDEKLANF